MVEMLLVLPLVLSVVFGIVQWGFVSQSKITLNAATEQAARAGALNNGNIGAIRKAFAEGMTPLFMNGQADRAGLVQGYLRARVQTRLRGNITILNPNVQVFNRFRQNVLYPLQNRRIWEIPNDNLMFRPTITENVGGGVTMNIQDANLLRLQVDWCQELIVPIIGDLILESVRGFIPSAAQLRCDAISRAVGTPLIAVQSMATYRMQTPFRRN